MLKSLLTPLLTALAKMLVPFVVYYSGFKAGENKEQTKRLENENKALKEALSASNSRPVTDDDINRMLDEWKNTN